MKNQVTGCSVYPVEAKDLSIVVQGAFRARRSSILRYGVAIGGPSSRTRRSFCRYTAPTRLKETLATGSDGGASTPSIRSRMSGCPCNSVTGFHFGRHGPAGASAVPPQPRPPAPVEPTSFERTMVLLPKFAPIWQDHSLPSKVSMSSFP
jgi:hypothetical protein